MSYQPKYTDPLIDQLYKAILTLETKEDCERFFDDICTISEVQSLSQRLKVAELLDNQETYSHIEDVTGASTATISRISKCLQSQTGGYKLILERLKAKQK
ncbi:MULTISPECIES: YerC/YecD family TrpR-related protein [unclassified Fusibacter]|uniref:YerC/YecD family TrpR-related protein n=1 Tax=unclassified Fusibacter TaxID=2624464 RepID=UPI001013986D|nr:MULTISPECIES: YerC/YecD family TrpR-related protein [unclassified Fusibacter]MCK8059616.1 YerC/YecD family TrpR-related protein [Fusibacter sp. A2]NPE21417.1 TrpR-like protein YerC/YecD [Fusibacter sp. A1]RXV61830.1 TrpR-like protein YerC/YecD [Fusibacter sp. A1]